MRLGKDATDAFEDVGHSDEAREILAGLYKGDLERRVYSIFFVILLTLQSGDPKPTVKESTNHAQSSVQQTSSSATYSPCLHPRLIVLGFPVL